MYDSYVTFVIWGTRNLNNSKNIPILNRANLNRVFQAEYSSIYNMITSVLN